MSLYVDNAELSLGEETVGVETPGGKGVDGGRDGDGIPKATIITIQKFWNYIEQCILITFDIQTHLTDVDVLFGIKQHNYGKVKTKRINHITVIAKMCISMYKKRKNEKYTRLPSIVHDI